MPYICRCNGKSRKVNRVLSELKFLRIEGDPVSGTQVKPLTCLEERCFNGVCPHTCIVHTFDLVFKVCDDGIKALIIRISTGHESLWSHHVPVTPPSCNECGDVSVFFADWYRMVTVPCICHSLLRTLRDLVS